MTFLAFFFLPFYKKKLTVVSLFEMSLFPSFLVFIKDIVCDTSDSKEIHISIKMANLTRQEQECRKKNMKEIQSTFG